MPNVLPGYVRFLRGTKAAFDKIMILKIRLKAPYIQVIN